MNEGPRQDDHRWWDERRADRRQWSGTTPVVAGILLIGAGAVLLAVNTFGMRLPFELGTVGWPVFIIVPGLAVLVIALATRGEPGVGIATTGGILATVGLLLAYQSTTDHWASWAYAWALVAPASVGLSMLLWGAIHRSGTVVRQGLAGLGVGIVLFTIGFAFFEGVLNIGGERGLAPLGRQALPVALIGVGVPDHREPLLATKPPRSDAASRFR